MMSSCSVRIVSFLYPFGLLFASKLLYLCCQSTSCTIFLSTISIRFMFLYKFSWNWLSKFTSVGGARCSKTIALVCCMVLLFPCTTCELTGVDGLELFIARSGKDSVFSNLTKVISFFSDIFQCPLSPCAVISWRPIPVAVGCSYFCDLMIWRPICSTDVFGCFHQPHRKGSNQSRLPPALALWRRRQSRLGTLEKILLISKILYPQV